MARKAKESGGKRRRPGDTRRRRLLTGLKWGTVATVWTLFLGLCFVGWLAYDLPDVSRLDQVDRRPSVTLLAADGSLIAAYGDLYAEPVTLADLPGYLPQAVLATEDRRFYRHPGFDPLGLLRALYVNIRAWDWVQGGSSITQQLAKNVFLTPARTLRRKGQEFLLALWLERRFTKDEILTLYLNRVYFGAGTYGVDAAARRYFGKPAAEVNRFEAALLAGLLKAPSRYNPLNDRNLADSRARLVLDNMVDADFITKAEAEAAVIEGFTQGSPATRGPIGQYFADWVLDQLPGYVGFSDRDLVVTTTLDPRIERLAEDKLAGLMAKDGPAEHAGEAALLAMTPEGAVKAMVGGRSYRTSQFNRATQAQRQPGSAFKPFVYLAAFEAGYRIDSRMFDGPISIGNWQPKNYDEKYFGEVTLREAFARSLNSVAAQLTQAVGVQRVVDTARRLGIVSNLMATPSIALGTSEVNLLELTGAYAVLANRGVGVLPYAILDVRDRDGNLLYAREGSGLTRLLRPASVVAMQDAMAATIDWGTGKAARIDRPAGGKTGTAQDYRDAWFVGYSAELVTGVWVGNDDNRPMDKVVGGGLPARIWHDFMTAALEGEPAQPLPWPGGGSEPAIAALPLEAPLGTAAAGSGAQSEAAQASADPLGDLIESIFGQPTQRK